MTLDNEPEQQQIDHWLKVSHEAIDDRLNDPYPDYYEQKNLPIQSFYTGLSSEHAALARAQFLNGEPPEVFRKNFSKAAGYMLKNFNMVYDKNDPDYVGDRPETDLNGFGYGCVDRWSVGETEFVEGVQYALLAGDFDTARALAKLYQNPKEKYLEGEKEVNRYAKALKLTLLDDIESAKAQLQPTIDQWNKKQTRNPFKLNYIIQSITLYGILDNDEATFNKGLTLYLSFYESYAQGEGKDTDYEFICSEAVALANLGLHFKLNVTAEHYTLPKGMLIESGR